MRPMHGILCIRLHRHRRTLSHAMGLLAIPTSFLCVRLPVLLLECLVPAQAIFSVHAMLHYQRNGYLFNDMSFYSEGPQARIGGSIRGRVRWAGLARSKAMPGRWCRWCSRAGAGSGGCSAREIAQGCRVMRREHRADSAGLRGIRRAGRYAALACPLEFSGRGCAQAGAAAVYRFTVDSDKSKRSAVARMLARFSVRHARTAAASCAGGLPRLSLPR
jgi:hypothetical protein